MIAVCDACDIRTRVFAVDGRPECLCVPCIREFVALTDAIVTARTPTPAEERHACHEIPEPGCVLCARLGRLA